MPDPVPVVCFLFELLVGLMVAGVATVAGVPWFFRIPLALLALAALYAAGYIATSEIQYRRKEGRWR